MPTNEMIERRSLTIGELRVSDGEADDRGPRIEGYAAVFDVQSEDLGRPRVHHTRDLRQIEPQAAATVLLSLFTTGVLDKNPPHCLRCRSEEVSPTVPVLGLLHVHQPDVGIVNESGGLKSLPRQLVT